MHLLLLLLLVGATSALEHDLPLNRHSYICVACAPLANFAACISECACGWCQNTTDSRTGTCLDANLDGVNARPLTCADGLWHSDAAQARWYVLRVSLRSSRNTHLSLRSSDLYPASLVAGLAAALAVALTLLAVIALAKCVARCRRRMRG